MYFTLYILCLERTSPLSGNIALNKRALIEGACLLSAPSGLWSSNTLLEELAVLLSVLCTNNFSLRIYIN